MDRGKRPSQSLGAKNHKIYMDLKDIIREHALPCLPAKSLFRFMGVCRDWKLWISTPFFAHSQSLSFHAISGLFCQSHRDSPSFVSMDPKSSGVPDSCLKFLPESVQIRASSNGLLCCQANTNEKTYYICNPATKQWKKLPKPNADHGPDPVIVLVFEPSLLNFVAEYKLICAFPSTDFDNATEFEIYSSAEGTWKVSGEICFASKNLVPGSGICVDSVVYWQLSSHGIVAFDHTKERSQLMTRYLCPRRGRLGKVNGKLCSAYSHGCAIEVSVLSNIYSNTMQMHGHSSGWQLQTVHLNNSAVGGTNPDLGKVLLVEDDLALVQAGDVILSCSMKNKETKVISHGAEHCMRCFPYVNSLVSL